MLPEGYKLGIKEEAIKSEINIGIHAHIHTNERERSIYITRTQ